MNHVRQEEKRQTSRATSSSSSWWTCLWWHHHDRVWLICLIAHEQHWCLEPDLYYAAEKQRRDKEAFGLGRVGSYGVCICLQSAMQGEHFSQTIFIPMSAKHQEEKKKQNEIKNSDAFKTTWRSCKRTLKCEKWRVSGWISGRRKMSRTQQKKRPCSPSVVRWLEGFSLFVVLVDVRCLSKCSGNFDPIINQVCLCMCQQGYWPNSHKAWQMASGWKSFLFLYNKIGSQVRASSSGQEK